MTLFKIPQAKNQLSVTVSHGRYDFYYHSGLTTVTDENSDKWVSYCAFKSCDFDRVITLGIMYAVFMVGLVWERKILLVTHHPRVYSVATKHSGKRINTAKTSNNVFSAATQHLFP